MSRVLQNVSVLFQALTRSDGYSTRHDCNMEGARTALLSTTSRLTASSTRFNISAQRSRRKASANRLRDVSQGNCGLVLGLDPARRHWAILDSNPCHLIKSRNAHP